MVWPPHSVLSGGAVSPLVFGIEGTAAGDGTPAGYVSAPDPVWFDADSGTWAQVGLWVGWGAVTGSSNPEGNPDGAYALIKLVDGGAGYGPLPEGGTVTLSVRARGTSSLTLYAAVAGSFGVAGPGTVGLGGAGTAESLTGSFADYAMSAEIVYITSFGDTFSVVQLYSAASFDLAEVSVVSWTPGGGG